MHAPFERPAAAARWILVAAGLAAAAAAAARSESPLPPAGVQPFAIPFFIDAKLGDGIRGALVEAARRLSTSRCQDLLGDFTDERGLTLAANLQATGQTLPAYLGYVLFYDGSATEPCRAERVLAWTSPGSRAVHVCPAQFSYWQRANPGYAATIVIHETLHTLGLGERPPTSGEITAKVIERCGN
jgi:hypothetical protein